ncbi:lipoyl domain-containing protein [Dactylosporangium sp. CA-233914]|uniref:lipoyl domain-containing protein n=1 Tax=Dactylosporangium sp. CA-233914 TaxID=3239934 RepID=UPI003D911DCD
MTVKLPRVADTVDEVVVLDWEAPVGQSVSAGDILMRVETDKAVVEIPSPVAGVLTEQLVAVDEDITTGQAIAVITI